jgi:hypothetical protein
LSGALTVTVGRTPGGRLGLVEQPAAAASSKTAAVRVE